ncbi:hypothetical protein BV22DRAFT_907201 [Leucogyrophana mollusca]|uniref:Uncharacterized protein n=1 Tax=Leucogyrophana mollusca TaxID=85980 RepID=A0ACB8B046_9AGAM|nr:hypothetical protein BV22DRAFT_907201 [Leucogyrophana mollusca]
MPRLMLPGQPEPRGNPPNSGPVVSIACPCPPNSSLPEISNQLKHNRDCGKPILSHNLQLPPTCAYEREEEDVPPSWVHHFDVAKVIFPRRWAIPYSKIDLQGGVH